MTPLTPHDPWFELFFYIGIAAVVAVVLWGAYISYDDWKERKREEGRDAKD